MGVNDAREQLEVAKAEYVKLEAENQNLRTTASEDLRMIRKLEAVAEIGDIGVTGGVLWEVLHVGDDDTPEEADRG